MTASRTLLANITEPKRAARAMGDAAVMSKLDAAELRIGMADDVKLAKMLDPALVNIMGFLASPSAAVKAKAMGILSHINKRLKADEKLPLPLAGLVKVLTNEATPSIVQNFALVYIDMGLPRVTAAERASMVPSLLVGIAKRPAAQQDTLLGVLLAALPVLPLPKLKDDLGGDAPTLPFLVAADDRALVLAWLLDLLLFMPPLAATPHVVAPGLSRAAAKRVCGKLADAEVRGELLAAKKMAALRLLDARTSEGAGQFGELFAFSETLAHWVVASADNDHGVAAFAETALRRLKEESLEEPRLVDGLTALVLGTISASPAAAAKVGSPSASTAGASASVDDPMTSRTAASVAVRLKALGYLHKSKAAANRFPGTLQAIFHSIFGSDATPRLQQAGCQLAQWTAQMCDDALLHAVGGHLLMGMLKVLRGEATQSMRVDAPEAVMMRSSAYATLGRLCQRAPQHVKSDTRLPAELFTALETEQLGARSQLQEALAALAEVHARRPDNNNRSSSSSSSGSSPSAPTGGGSSSSSSSSSSNPAMLAALRALLLRAAASTSQHARYCSMVWIGKAFGRADLPTRFACLLAVADVRSEVSEAAQRALRPLAVASGGADKPPAAAASDAAGATAAAGEAPGAGKGTPAAGAPPSLAAGDRVTHLDKSSGAVRLGSVVAVHTDDAANGAYYTVALEDGSERSVEAASIEALPRGWPALGALARVLLGRTALHPQPPNSGTSGTDTGTGGMTPDVAAFEGALEEAGAAPIPLAALPEVIAYLMDCARIEAKALARRAASSRAAGGAGAEEAAAAAAAAAVAADVESEEEAEEAAALGMYISDALGGSDDGDGASPSARPRGVRELISLLLGCLSCEGSSEPVAVAAPSSSSSSSSSASSAAGGWHRREPLPARAVTLSGAPPELLASASASLLLLLRSSPSAVGRCLRPALPQLQSLMLTRTVAEESTMLALCQILALAARADDGVALVGELLPMLPPTELTGCNGLKEQQKVVGAALGLGHIGAAFIAHARASSGHGGGGGGGPGGGHGGGHGGGGGGGGGYGPGLNPAVSELLAPVTLRLANLMRHEQLGIASAAATALGHLGGAAPLPIPDGEVAAEEAAAESADTADKEPAGGDEGSPAPMQVEASPSSSVSPSPSSSSAAAAPDAPTTTSTATSTTTSSSSNKPPPPVAKRASPPQTKVELAYAMLHLLSHSKARHAAVGALGRLMSGEVHGPFRNLILAHLFGLASTKDVDLHLAVGEALARIGATAVPPPPPPSDAAAAAAAASTSAFAARLPPLAPVIPPKKAGVATDGAGLAIGAAAAAANAETLATTSAASAGGPLMPYLLRKILQEYLVAWTPLVRQAACAWTLSLLRVSGNLPSVRAAAAEVQRGLVSLLADPMEATQELAAKALSMLFERCDAETQEHIVKELVSALATTRTASAAASGGEMATFAELSDIANNAGQPELVYKLMELSTASAVWNTRKGVALALAGQSRERFDAHLHKLIPTLYRYTFDPNPRIAQAMKQVWSSLVPDPKRALTEHLGAVLDHLLEGLVGREWRAREASCYGLAESLTGRTYDEVKGVLKETHTRLMRTIDDIKESVRKAALAAWRALSSVINRLCDGTLAPAAQAAATLELVLPTLLEFGISHASDDVRALCTRQLLGVCKAAGSHIAAHVVVLVPALLETLSVIEDPMLNYLQQHSESAGLEQGALEAARVNAIRGSDATTAIDTCLRVMDAPQVSFGSPSNPLPPSNIPSIPSPPKTLMPQSYLPNLPPLT